MDIIIKTEFEKITHSIDFQPTTMPKGKALVKAQHVRAVQEEHKIGLSCRIISADVIRQTSVSSTPYVTKLKINQLREVIGVSCTCVYNQSGKCKHVAALIYYINHVENWSKTDQEQVWGQVSTKRFSQDMYSKGKYFYEMYPPKKKPHIKPMPLKISELEDSALRGMLLASEESENDLDIEDYVKDILNKVEFQLDTEKCEAFVKETFMFAIDHPIYTSNCKMSEAEEQFYLKNIFIDRKNIVQLCCDTIKQSNCDKWFESRKLRISASINVHNIKIRNKKTVESLLVDMLYPKNIKSKSTVYGTSNEKEAKTIYEKMYDVEVLKVGVLVSDKQPWLCVSLDGVVIKNNCVTKIVEFKCPITCADLKVVDHVNKKCNINYLEFCNDQIELKKSSSYYTQCQVQMYVSGLCTCDLFIYSPVENGCCCVEVHRDEEFLQSVIIKSEEFYFRHYLPALLLKSTKDQKIKRVFTGKNILNEI